MAVQLGGGDPALERLAEHVQAGSGADDMPTNRRELGGRVLRWWAEVAPHIETEDGSLPSVTEVLRRRQALKFGDKVSEELLADDLDF